MNISRFRLITFDVTDTLLKFRSSPGKQYGEVAALYGINCDYNALTTNFKSRWVKMNQEHPNFGRESGLGWEMWWKQIVIGTFQDSESSLDHQRLKLVALHLIELYETSLCWQLSEGALGLLSFLKNRGVTLGVISNFDPRLEVLLRNTKLRHYFNFLVGSYEAGVEKPSSDIFKLAMDISKVRNLKPSECLHVGDAALLDYNGAMKSGWNGILISENYYSIVKKHPHVNSDHIYSSLHELHKIFANMNNGYNLKVQLAN